MASLPTVELAGAEQQEQRPLQHHQEASGQHLLQMLATAVHLPSKECRHRRRTRRQSSRSSSESSRRIKIPERRGTDEAQIVKRNAKKEKEGRKDKKDRGRTPPKHGGRCSSGSSNGKRVSERREGKINSKHSSTYVTHAARERRRSSSHRQTCMQQEALSAAAAATAPAAASAATTAAVAVPRNKDFTQRRGRLEGSNRQQWKELGSKDYGAEEKLARSFRLQQRCRLLRLLQQQLELQQTHFSTAALLND